MSLNPDAEVEQITTSLHVPGNHRHMSFLLSTILNLMIFKRITIFLYIAVAIFFVHEPSWETIFSAYILPEGFDSEYFLLHFHSHYYTHVNPFKYSLKLHHGAEFSMQDVMSIKDTTNRALTTRSRRHHAPLNPRAQRTTNPWSLLNLLGLTSSPAALDYRRAVRASGLTHFHPAPLFHGVFAQTRAYVIITRTQMKTVGSCALLVFRPLRNSVECVTVTWSGFKDNSQSFCLIDIVLVWLKGWPVWGLFFQLPLQFGSKEACADLISPTIIMNNKLFHVAM